LRTKEVKANIFIKACGMPDSNPDPGPDPKPDPDPRNNFGITTLLVDIMA
jgi:hypothetical protein